jgi:hypothetical protein
VSVKAKCLIESVFAPIATATQYTAPGGVNTIIDKFTATNTTGSTITLTVYLVPNGSTAGASNELLNATSIASGATFISTEMQNQILNSGDSIAVIASATGLMIRASGRECS